MLPDAAKHPRIKGGMTVTEVRRILSPGTFVDDAFDLRLPVVDGPKKEVIGYHNVMWLDGYVNKIHFYRGKTLDHIEGMWLLSEYEKEDNKMPEPSAAPAPQVQH
jgi:hypothetical protein